MPKDKKPRRRTKPAVPKQPETEPAAAVVVRSQPTVEPAPLVTRFASVIRTVAGALIDIADATAEALTKRLNVIG